MIPPILTLVCYLILFSRYASVAKNPVHADATMRKYEPTWESLDSRPLPEWYDQDKFGIFIHWGIFSVPALGDWFWYNWKVYESKGAVKYMNDNYKPNFSYVDFARDFTAEFYNATEWAVLFEKSGAKYVVLTSKHHEGYTLWPSKYSTYWNSVDVGPHRDLIRELADAVRTHTKLRFGVYHSLYEWFNYLYLDDKKNNFTTSRFVDFKSGAELYELVEMYQPEVIWSDGEWEVEDDYWKAKQFLSWLYNESPVKDTVVVNDRWGSNTLCKHGGFLTCADRYNPGKIQNRKWENAMTIDKSAWGYRRNVNVNDFYTSQELIEFLVETVSFGGNLLLNVAPTKEGKIPPIYQERILDIGKWLATNEEAIYKTSTWNVCQNDTATPNVWYTAKYKEQSNADAILYAIFTTWPKSGNIFLKCVQNLQPPARAKLLGNDIELKWNVINGSTEIQLPNKSVIDSDWAWTIEITNNGTHIITTN